MYRELLRSIAGVQAFPIISLCLFVAVFVVIIIRAYRLDARRLSEFAQLPLDGPADDGIHYGTSHKGARR